MLHFQLQPARDALIITMERATHPHDEGTPAQREWLYRTIQAQDETRFAIDLGKIESMCSADIGFLLAVKHRIDLHQGRVALFRVDPEIRHTLHTLRLDQQFLIAVDLDDALEKLAAPAEDTATPPG